jgi:hypothetical protein
MSVTVLSSPSQLVRDQQQCTTHCQSFKKPLVNAGPSLQLPDRQLFQAVPPFQDPDSSLQENSVGHGPLSFDDVVHYYLPSMGTRPRPPGTWYFGQA